MSFKNKICLPISLLILLVLINSLFHVDAKPNIVVILADDIGLGDISFHTENFSNRKPVFKTANIDTLARQGVWFSDGHSATALCAPTRYAAMTGKNNYRSYAPWGVWGSFQPNAISDDDHTLASVMRQAGYETGFVGKWHLGGDFKVSGSNNLFRGRDEGPLPQVDFQTMVGGGPNNLGFDYSFMLPDGIQGPLYLAYENQQWYPLGANSKIIHINEKTALNPKIISDKGDGMGDSAWNTADIGNKISNKAVDFIQQQSSSKPFFLYYASPMAHLPHIPPESFDGQRVAGATGSDHMDMILELDFQIGRIIRSLKQKGFYQDTLIMFTSDNGGLTYKVPGTLASGHQPSGGFRGSKNSPHEGGHRVPFIASWPQQIEKSTISNEMVLIQDILATIAAASGYTMNAKTAPDSNNLLPLITNKKGYQSRKIALLQGGSRNELIFREGPWKLIIDSDNKLSKFEPTGLFNLDDNIKELESKNYIKSSQHQDRVKKMLARYFEIRNSKVATRQF